MNYHLWVVQADVEHTDFPWTSIRVRTRAEILEEIAIAASRIRSPSADLWELLRDLERVGST